MGVGGNGLICASDRCGEDTRRSWRLTMKHLHDHLNDGIAVTPLHVAPAPESPIAGIILFIGIGIALMLVAVFWRRSASVITPSANCADSITNTPAQDEMVGEMKSYLIEARKRGGYEGFDKAIGNLLASMEAYREAHPDMTLTPAQAECRDENIAILKKLRQENRDQQAQNDAWHASWLYRVLSSIRIGFWFPF
jgi:hypothetical protein